jgi:hypothetical protein
MGVELLENDSTRMPRRVVRRCKQPYYPTEALQSCVRTIRILHQNDWSAPVHCPLLARRRREDMTAQPRFFGSPQFFRRKRSDSPPQVSKNRTSQTSATLLVLHASPRDRESKGPRFFSLLPQSTRWNTPLQNSTRCTRILLPYPKFFF